MTMNRRHIATLTVVLVAAVAGVLPSQDADALGAAPVTRSCGSSRVNALACGVVSRFFEDAARGRFAASCSVLGARLRYESGGPSCRRKLASAYFVGSNSWAVVGVRPWEGGVGVVVRLELPELDHVRRLLWLATVGRADGRRRILATRIVGELGSLRHAPGRRTLAAWVAAR